MSISQTGVGKALSPLVKPPITQEQLRRYAHASGDFNPIHLDEEAARRVGLDGVIAHGMLGMAFLGQFLSLQLNGDPEAIISQLKVRFVNMVRLGDTLTCQGVVKGRSRVKRSGRRVERSSSSQNFDPPQTHEKEISYTYEQETITVDCWTQNQRGEKVIQGEAVVIVPRFGQ